MGQVVRQPGGEKLAFTMDAGGSEFAQIFLFDPAGSEAAMISDGRSRNGAVVWDRQGEPIAFQSTRRNGASNDIWILDPDRPGSERRVLASPDGTWC